MEETEIKLKNNTLFCALSSKFPELKMFRWCSSVIDYIELYGDGKELERANEELTRIASELHSEIVHMGLSENRMSAAITCRCSLGNSTIRVAESMNLMWEAPAIYEGGYETIKVISFNPEDLTAFFDHETGKGEITLEKKRMIRPELLRQVYTISLADLLGNLSGKQLEYLADAINKGLFSTPRKIMVADLARAHNVTKSTMQEHINKARNKLIQKMEPYLNLFVHSG